jgi:hypothetical protein
LRKGERIYEALLNKKELNVAAQQGWEENKRGRRKVKVSLCIGKGDAVQSVLRYGARKQTFGGKIY